MKHHVRITTFLIIILLAVIAIIFFSSQQKEASVRNTPAEVPDFNDQIIVEEYVRENITTIAPDNPVLGGSWYVTTVEISTQERTGTVTYEDGHIQGIASFSFAINGTTIEIYDVEKIL